MPDSLSELSLKLSSLVGRLSLHVVAVRAGSAAVSGFVWREGLVVTAEEHLDADKEITVTLPDGSRAPAALAGRDPSTDVALLRVDASLPPPVALDTGTPRALGELVVALGRDHGGPVAALGILESLGPAWRSLRGGTIDARLGLDLRLPRTAEGGLALDAEGRPFGMLVTGPRRSTLVIPAATIERVASQLLSRGRIVRGYLGLGLQSLRIDGSGDPALVIISVDAQGPGQRAGLIQGDILLRLGGETVGGSRSLVARLGPEVVGSTVEIEILRGGERRIVSLDVGEHPGS